jgi:hypothetical protein
MSIVPVHILDEKRIEISRAAKLLGTDERPASMAKMSRAIRPGVLAENGERIRLEAVRTGGCWITSVEAVQRFVDRLTRAALGDVETADVPSAVSKTRERELARVDRELDEAGI